MVARIFTLALTVMTLSLALIGCSKKEPPRLVAPPERPVPADFIIRQIPAEGSDIANAMNAEVYKFSFTLPQDIYHIDYSIDKWEKNNAIQSASSAFGVPVE